MALLTGRVPVTTAGTRVQLATTSSYGRFITITAWTNNTNPVTIGGTAVVGALATRQGTPLSAGQSMTFIEQDLQAIWADAVTSGEGVTYTITTE